MYVYINLIEFHVSFHECISPLTPKPRENLVFRVLCFGFLYCQKLTADMDKVLQEKASLEVQLGEENRHTPSTDKHTEQDWKILESRLKVSLQPSTLQSKITAPFYQVYLTVVFEEITVASYHF